MAKLEIAQLDEAPNDEYLNHQLTTTGVRSSRRLTPPEFPLYLTLVELDSGGELQWGTSHADEAIYVQQGNLRIGNLECHPGGAVIIEGGIPAVLSAASYSHLLYARQAPGHAREAERRGQYVHVVGNAGWFVSGDREHIEATWFADSTCGTCEIALFTVSKGPGEASDGPAHAHSADEVIYVLDGAVRLGKRRYGKGTSLCIPADQRYTLSATEDGYTFLNYRSEHSSQSYYSRGKDKFIVPEDAVARGGRIRNAVTHLDFPVAADSRDGVQP